MTNDEMYDSYRTDFKYLRIVFKVIIALIAVIALLLIVRCEQTDYSNPECCWLCKSQVTWYNPQPGIEEIVTTVTYADSIYCDCSDEQIKWMETEYTKTDTVDGVKRETVFQCRK